MARAEGEASEARVVELAESSLAAGRAALDGMDFERARTELAVAERTFRKTDLRKHRDAFLEALGLLAAAELFAGEGSEARNTLRVLLTFDPEWRLPPDRKTPRLEEVLDAVRDETRGLRHVSLQVDTVPAGARVVLDGRELGETPVTLPDLLPGRHILRCEKPGFDTRQEEVFVGPATKVAWTLTGTALPGTGVAVSAGAGHQPAEPADAVHSIESAQGGPGDQPASRPPEAEAKEKPAQAAAVTPEAAGAPAARNPRSHRGVILLASAGAAAGIGAFAIWRSLAAEDALSTIPQTDEDTYRATLSRGRAYVAIADVALPVTVVGAALGTYFLFHDRRGASPVSVGVTPVRRGAVLALGGRF
jgi:hypothetical protein